MEKWAERIKQLLDAGKPRLTQLGLAKACGRSQPSISQWFNDSDSKPATTMIMGDNLVAAAEYLGTTPEWIMTGKGPAGRVSQSGRLDPVNVSITITALLVVLRRRDKSASLDLQDPIDAELFCQAYAELEKLEGTPGSDVAAGAVIADLAAIREERRNGSGGASKQVGSTAGGKDRRARSG